MAYAGYLIKVLKKDNSGTDYIIPMDCIVEKSYKMVYSILEKSSTRNGKGVLVRNNVLPHVVPHGGIKIRSLNNTQLSAILTGISSRYTKKKQRQVKLSVFIPFINDYKEEFFYVPDVDIAINHIEQATNTVIYDPVELELIGY